LLVNYLYLPLEGEVGEHAGKFTQPAQAWLRASRVGVNLVSGVLRRHIPVMAYACNLPRISILNLLMTPTIADASHRRS
jgi:hypothetical protein